MSQPAWINVFGDVESAERNKVDLRREASTEGCFHGAHPEVSIVRMRCARGGVEGSREIAGRVESVVLGRASSIRSTIFSESSAESAPVSIDIARRKAIESAIKYS